jgi:hypothetical protein
MEEGPVTKQKLAEGDEETQKQATKYGVTDPDHKAPAQSGLGNVALEEPKPGTPMPDEVERVGPGEAPSPPRTNIETQ